MNAKLIRKATDVADANAPWPYPRLVAHRGAGRLAPENTLAAFRCGAAHGYRMFEFDVKLSCDGVPYCLHDDELNRTTDGQGPVAALDWAGLNELDAGGWHGPQYCGEPLLRLDRLCRFLDANDFAANVEIKPVPGTDTATGAAVGAYLQQRRVQENAGERHAGERHAGERGASGRRVAGPRLDDKGWPALSRCPVLTSFSPRALAASIAAAPDLLHGLLLDAWEPDWRARLSDLNCACIVFNHRVLTRARVREIRDAGVRLMCYTANGPARVRELLQWGIDSVITDAVDRIDPSSI